MSHIDSDQIDFIGVEPLSVGMLNRPTVTLIDEIIAKIYSKTEILDILSGLTIESERQVFSAATNQETFVVTDFDLAHEPMVFQNGNFLSNFSTSFSNNSITLPTGVSSGTTIVIVHNKIKNIPTT